MNIEELNEWFDKKINAEKEKLFAEQSLTSYLKLWLLLSFEEKQRASRNAPYSGRHSYGYGDRVRGLRDRFRALVQQPGRILAKYRWTRMSRTERHTAEDAHLTKVLSVLRGRGRARVRAVPMDEARTRLWPHVAPTKARAPGGRIGPLDDSEMDNAFVKFILEGSSWAPQPETAAAVEPATPTKEKKRARSRRT